jgi:hypothetical protein
MSLPEELHPRVLLAHQQVSGACNNTTAISGTNLLSPHVDATHPKYSGIVLSSAIPIYNLTEVAQSGPFKKKEYLCA